MKQLADILLEKEVIFSDDLEVIFGKRPWAKSEELPKKVEKKAEKKVEKKVEKKAEEKDKPKEA